MLVFRLLFYFLLALFIPILLQIVNSLVGGRPRSAWMALRVYLVIAAIYATVLVAVTLALPLEMVPANEVQYSGDWSIGVASLRRVPHSLNSLDEDYEIDFRLGNRGSKPIHGESNLTAYLLTEDGTRYNAAPTPSDPPFDAEVKPGKSLLTTRKFLLPTNLNRVELVIARTGFRLGWFIIGRTPLDGRTVILLQKG